MGKIVLTQTLKDLDGESMRMGEPHLPGILTLEDEDTLDEEHRGKYEVKGRFLKLKKEFHKYLMLRGVLTGALLFRVEEDDKKLSNEEVMERVLLAQRVHEAQDFSFTAEQTVMLKKLVNRKWAPINMLIVGQAFDMLEPKEKDEQSSNGHIPGEAIQTQATA